jgi:hypothetical protein
MFSQDNYFFTKEVDSLGDKIGINGKIRKERAYKNAEGSWG